MAILLLDTHVALWMVADDPRLGGHVREEIVDPSNDVLLSAASVWEAEIKKRLGRLHAPDDLWSEVEHSGVTFVAVDRADAIAAAGLPLFHRDPFDRMLVAQADLRHATLVTADRWVSAYSVPVLRADQ